MRILAISGSLRQGSSNAAVLRAAARVGPSGMEFVFYEGLAELPHFNPDLDGEGATAPPAVDALRAAVRAAAPSSLRHGSRTHLRSPLGAFPRGAAPSAARVYRQTVHLFPERN